MDISGNGFTIQGILLLVGAQARSGEIVLESGNNIGNITVHKGRILQASSPYSRAIGDLLVEKGVIAESELLDALALQRKQHVLPIGMILLRTGKVSFDLIEKLVHEQIRRAIADFDRWEDLQVAFHAKENVPCDRIGLPAREFIKSEITRSVTQYLSGA